MEKIKLTPLASILGHPEVLDTLQDAKKAVLNTESIIVVMLDRQGRVRTLWGGVETLEGVGMLESAKLAILGEADE